MKAKELIKLLEQYPDYDVRLMYADCSVCSWEHLYPDYQELKIYGVNANLTTETLKTLYLAYEEM